MLRRHLWIAIGVCASISLLCLFFQSNSRPDKGVVSAAEDRVYEAVVRDMVAPTRGQASLKQLVFDDTVLTGLTTGGDIKTCQESVRKRVQLEDYTPPYNSLADKIYRVLTRGWYDGSPRASTIQDFIKRSCAGGPLSRTFQTEFPRVFIDSNSVFIDLVPIHRNGLKDFRQAFPGASGIISLSHVGFDSSLHEAIVSSSFVCGLLCGTGQIYILRNIHGRWEVISHSVVWVS
jgi:hypothetical protein